MKERVYQFGQSKLILRFGDITTAQSKVIVSSDDYYISMGGGVSASILKAGGNEIALDAAKKVPAKLGEVVVTTAGRLNAEFIFHAITIGKPKADINPKEVIKNLTGRCLQLLDLLDLESIAFPALGAGTAKFSYNEVAVEMAKAISEYLIKSEKRKEIIIYLYDKYQFISPENYLEFFMEFATKAPQIAQQEVKAEKSQLPEVQDLIIIAQDTEIEIKAKRINYLRKQLGSLEDQRSRLEEKLIDLLENSESEEYRKIEANLKKNEQLRLSRLKELKDLRDDKPIRQLKPETLPVMLNVFLSSTYLDLKEHRQAVKEQIIKNKMLFTGMEHFGAYPDNIPPANIIVEEVKKADIYIGIFGIRYGSIDEATGISMTELEYREAKATNKPMLLYILKDSANVQVCHIETDHTAREKLNRLKKEIIKEKMIYLFETVSDLEKQVYIDLEKIKKRSIIYK